MRKTKLTTCLILVIALFNNAVLASPGDLDTTFSGDGTLIVPVGIGDAAGSRSALQSDGKLIVAGQATTGSKTSAALVRYNTDGTLDSSFGDAGKVLTDFSSLGSSSSSDIALQSDGKIVVSGSSSNSNSSIQLFHVARYNASGSLDNSFDVDGIATTDTFSPQSSAHSLALQPDGKIVASGNGFLNGLAVVRYNTNGTLDITFDGDGIATRSDAANVTVRRTLAQSDGKILLVGGISGFVPLRSIYLARFNADGSIDNTFDGDGKLETAIGNFATANGARIQSDGKIVIAGTGTVASQDYAIVRYNADGSSPVIFTTPIGTATDVAEDLQIDAAGKITAGGSSEFNGANDFSAIRLNANLTLDTSFTGSGKVRTDFETQADSAGSLNIQSNGSILLAGSSRATSFSPNRLAALRYDSLGELDTTYDIDGKVTTILGNGQSFGHATAVQGDGKILIAGTSGPESGGGTATIFRRNPDSTADQSFGTDGRVDINLSSSSARAALVQADGKILVSGHLSSAMFLCRLNSDGTFDPTFGGGNQVVFVNFGFNSFPILGGMALQSDGKIVLTGRGNTGAGNNVIVARFNADGSQDGSTTSTDIFNGTSEVGRSVAIQSDGKIVVGSNGVGNTDEAFVVLRYTSALVLDTTFSGDGIALADFFSGDDFATSVAIQSDGKIVAGGYASNGTNSDFALARFNPTNGLLDASFGVGGRVVTAVGSGDERINSIKIQNNGKIVAAGFSFAGLSNDFAIVRYNSNGSLDNTNLWGTNGIVTTDLGSDDVANAIALQSNGSILAVGSSGGNIAAARFLGDPLGPSAANVSVSGRITTADGRGISRVLLTLTDSNGITRMASTGSFGYYRFDDVPAGESYVLSVASKRYQFANTNRLISVSEDLTDVDFIASP